MVKPGDIVRFLNDVGGGKVVRIEGNIAVVVDADGFETPTLLRECVVVGQASTKPAAAETQQKVVPVEAVEPSDLLDSDDIAETPEGEKLNVVLAFEPRDIKALSKCGYDAYLVNDSNYYLYFTFLTRGSDTDLWATRYAGIVEPNIQVFVSEIEPSEVSALEHITVQCIAFKRGRAFAIKQPAAVNYRIDTTKFFKLHCFRDNIYFDTPVLAFDIVRDDIPARKPRVDAAELEQEMTRKKAADRRRKPVVKRPTLKRSERRQGEILEVDLHIHELVDTTAGLSSADMLNLQVDEFRRVMDGNLRAHGQKIVFIHGKGEGVLRNALTKELNHRYKGKVDVQDASFQQYGFGATQVTIK